VLDEQFHDAADAYLLLIAPESAEQRSNRDSIPEIPGDRLPLGLKL
jgi:hypothetical protein